MALMPTFAILLLGPSYFVSCNTIIGTNCTSELDCNDDDPCINGQCKVSINDVCEKCPRNSYCESVNNLKKCRCLPGFNQAYGMCRQSQAQQSDDSVRALEIYKITMIFASCLLAMVLVAFLYCIIKKSFCGSRSFHSTGPPDIMTLFAESAAESGSPFGVQPPFEKPPSYDESQNHMREIFGVPPPSYPGPSTSQGEVPLASPMNRRLSNIERVRAVLGQGLVAPESQDITTEAEIVPHEPLPGLQNRGFQPE